MDISVTVSTTPPLPYFFSIYKNPSKFHEINGCGLCLSVYVNVYEIERTVLCRKDHSGISLVSALWNPRGSLGGRLLQH